jgi:hypothetical protein
MAGWQPTSDGRWICIACSDSRPHSVKNIIRHENTRTHQHSVSYRLSQDNTPAVAKEDEDSKLNRSIPALRLVLEDMARHSIEPRNDSESYHLSDSYTDEASDMLGDDLFNSSYAPTGTARLSQALLKFLDGEDYSDDDSNERSEGERERMASEEERQEARSGWQFRKSSTL